MAVSVKRATLWKIDMPNTPGSLAASLSPLAEGNVNLDLVMGYSHPDKTGATIEVFPVDGASPQRAARRAGFVKSGFPCVAVSGTNRVGLGRQIAAALAEAGININFFIAQVVGKDYVGMFSFEAESEADLAVTIIRRAVKHAPLAAVRSKSASKAATTGRKNTKRTVTKKRATSKKKNTKRRRASAVA